MNGTETQSDEIARYLAGVRAALLDLPEDVRDDLLEDLPAHLAEMASEDPGELEARLGSPASYAAELRAAAGLRPGSAEGGRPGLSQRIAQAVALSRRVDLRLGRVIGYSQLSEYVRLLRPAWWLLRGYVVDIVLNELLSSPVSSALPRPDDDVLVGVVLLVACVLGSIWLGRRSVRLRGNGPRLAMLAGNALAGVLAVVILFGVNNRMDTAKYVDQNVNQLQDVTDIVPVGPDNKPLSGVTLYDQNGQQLQVGNPWNCSDATNDSDATNEEPEFRYPLCVNPSSVIIPPGALQNAPTASPSPEPSGAPATSAPPAGPDASTTPSVQPTGAVTPAPPSGSPTG